LEFLLGINEIKIRTVVGSEQKQGMASLESELGKLENLYTNLKQNFEEKQNEWEKDFENGERMLMEDKHDMEDMLSDIGQVDNKTGKKQKNEKVYLEKI